MRDPKGGYHISSLKQDAKKGESPVFGDGQT